MSYSLYLHVPFCEQRCHYCAFPVSLAQSHRHPAYVERLIRELELSALQGAPETLYLGGGTPSLLAPELIQSLMRAVGRIDGEVSIEANPGTLDPAGVRLYRELGVNRVSLGAQSFLDGDLERMGRLHGPLDTVDDYHLLRRHGFENINLDLIAGFPEQSSEAWNENLDWIERLAPDHVSVYLLELEEPSRWGASPPPARSDSDDAWFYSVAAERLDRMGYRHYEISSWALPLRECRHNQGYWTGRPYRGLGLGAHSYMDGKRFWNTRSMVEYADALDRGLLPTVAIETPTAKMRIEEAFLLGLRQADGFGVYGIAQELGISYPDEWFVRLDQLQQAGLVQFDGSRLNLTPSGWLLATGITEELLCPDLLSICEAIP